MNGKDEESIDQQTNDQKSIFTRTTLDQRIFMLNGGAELIAITVLWRLIPISYQTIKNQIGEKTFIFPIIKLHRKNYVRTADVVKFIESGATTQKKLGRKTNKERAEKKED